MANPSKKKMARAKAPVKKSRFGPVAVAAIICATLAVSTGYGAWYFISPKAKGADNRQKVVARISEAFDFQKKSESEQAQTASDDIPAVVSPATTPEQTPETPKIDDTPAVAVAPETLTPVAEVKEENASPSTSGAIEGTVFVSGGEVTIGGGKTGTPLQRKFVKDFYIAETEVTNRQYAEFIKETKRKPPHGWSAHNYPPGSDELPVTNVSHPEAVAFCKWLSAKLGAEVRLPSRFEWERAARGDTDQTYPWGNQWDDKGAACKENKGRVGKVKSFEKNKSFFGAYDMAGNVWEWTEDIALDEKGKEIYKDEYGDRVFKGGGLARIVKGGSAGDKKSNIGYAATDTISQHSKYSFVGFRYVVNAAKVV